MPPVHRGAGGACAATDGTGLSRISSVTLVPDAEFITVSWTTTYSSVTKFFITYTSDGVNYQKASADGTHTLTIALLAHVPLARLG